MDNTITVHCDRYWIAVREYSFGGKFFKQELFALHKAYMVYFLTSL